MIHCPDGSYPTGITREGNVENCMMVERSLRYIDSKEENFNIEIILLIVIIIMLMIALRIHNNAKKET
jgi:hypothetical protein